MKLAFLTIPLITALLTFVFIVKNESLKKFFSGDSFKEGLFATIPLAVMSFSAYLAFLIYHDTEFTIATAQSLSIVTLFFPIAFLIISGLGRIAQRFGNWVAHLIWYTVIVLVITYTGGTSQLIPAIKFVLFFPIWFATIFLYVKLRKYFSARTYAKLKSFSTFVLLSVPLLVLVYFVLDVLFWSTGFNSNLSNAAEYLNLAIITCVMSIIGTFFADRPEKILS